MKEDTLEIGKNTAWELFCKTGEIKYYGAYKSLEELQKQKQEEEQSGYSM